MKRDEFQSLFFERYGFEIDDQDLDDLFPQQQQQQQPHLHQRTQGPISYLGQGTIPLNIRNRAKGEDLLGEITGVFQDIATAAKTTVNKGKSKSLFLKRSNPQSAEFTYMFMLFAAKAVLYFVLQASYKDGFEFANL